MELSIIQSKIYEMRGYKVMLDFDLAEIYGTETAQLKRAVKRNIERFEGKDFMFEVTRDELSRCQIGILNKGRGSNIKYLPTRMQLELINEALAELQVKNKEQNKPRYLIGFKTSQYTQKAEK